MLCRAGDFFWLSGYDMKFTILTMVPLLTSSCYYCDSGEPITPTHALSEVTQTQTPKATPKATETPTATQTTTPTIAPTLEPGECPTETGAEPCSLIPPGVCP